MQNAQINEIWKTLIITGNQKGTQPTYKTMKQAE